MKNSKSITEVNNIIPLTNYKSDEIVLGIDEAGRGPVLGPMVYACSFYALKNQTEIAKHFKFADSKVLTEQKRDEIYAKMCENKQIIDFQAIVIHPQELSNLMLKRTKVSLNKISTDAAVQLIRDTLNKGVNVKEVYVDTVGPAEKYQEMLENKFVNHDIIFKVSAKADSLFPSVSAASIVAKVTRDSEVKNWKFKEEAEGNKIFDNKYGCGYPSDPITKKWMERNLDPVFGYPNIVRFSWKTTSNQFKTKGKTIKWENYVEDDDGTVRIPFIDKKNKTLDMLKVKKKFSYLEHNGITFNNLNII